MRRPHAPSPAGLLAGIALFLGLSGIAVAGGVELGKNSVNSGTIKNKSVKGGDLADDTLTGSQILESSLGPVPRAASAGTAAAATNAASAGTAKNAERAASAATADRAASAATADRATTATSADRATTAALADKATSATSAATAGTATEADHAVSADRVGGRPASDFASASDVFPVAARLAAGQSRTLVERDGVKLEARCQTNVATTEGGTATVLSIYASAAADGATLESPKSDKNGSSGNTLGPATIESERLAVQQTASTGTKVIRIPNDGVILTSVGGTSIFFGATSGIRVGFGLHGAVCSVTAPVVISVL